MRLERPSRGRLILVAGLLSALALCLGPTANPDIPWHLAVGRWIAAERAIPRVDFLSWTMAGKPWVDFEWLTQLLFHGLDRAGGLAALWTFKVFTYSLIGAILVSLLALWGMTEAWIGIAIFLLAAALRPFIEVRPENFSLLFFALQFLLLEARRLDRLPFGEKACLGAHVLLYALWANLHAGFPAGLLLCVCYGAAERCSLARPARLSPLAWVLAGLAGTLLNPYGPRLYTVFLDHFERLSSIRALIGEWSPPRLGNVYQRGYWGLTLFALAGFLVSVPKGVLLPLEHVVSVVVFGLLATRSIRTTSYLVILMFPVGLLAWSRLPSPEWWRRVRPWALVVALSLAAWRLGSDMREEGFLRRIEGGGNREAEKVCDFLRAEKKTLSGLTFFSPWNWGGYLDDKLYPDYRVYMDGRYIFHELLAEVDAAERNPVRWAQLMDRRGIDLALMINVPRIVSLGGQTSWRSFDAYAMPASAWALVYWDQQALVFVRRSKVPAQWLKSREFHHIRPHDLRNVGLRVMSGWLPLSKVSAEIDRYQSQIGDPYESLVLLHWLEEFKRGLSKADKLSAAAARRSTRPGSSKAASPRP